MSILSEILNKQSSANRVSLDVESRPDVLDKRHFVNETITETNCVTIFFCSKVNRAGYSEIEESLILRKKQYLPARYMLNEIVYTYFMFSVVRQHLVRPSYFFCVVYLDFATKLIPSREYHVYIPSLLFQQPHYQGLIEFVEKSSSNGVDDEADEAATISVIPYGITGLMDKKTMLQCGEKVRLCKGNWSYTL